MIHQQDPVGLITFDQKIRQCLRPKTRRGHLGDVLSLLANLKPSGETNIAHSLVQVAAMLRHASLVMIFSDLLADPGEVMESLYRLRHGGHDVILFHILDEAEVKFPFAGMVELEEPESHQRLALDADSFRKDYLAEVESFRENYRRECFQAGVDYVGLDTSMQFDRALTEYLVNRAARG
jgi:uncharacterized protein (DUF58 family)